MPTFQTVLDPLSHLNYIDWSVFSFFLLLTFAAVVYGNYKKKKIEQDNTEDASVVDLILMGRQLTLPLFVGTLVATWYGGIFGVTRIAYEHGIYNFITQGVFWYIAYIIFAFFILHRVARYKAITLPHLVGKMFGPRSEKIAAIFNILNLVPIAYTISLGLFLNLIFGIGLTLSMCIGLALVLSYSLWGGFRAVVFSDFIQFFVMCIAVFVVIIFSYFTLGGVSFLKAQLPAEHFSISGGEEISTLFVWGFIALATLVNPCFYQRCFASKSLKTAKYGILISTVVWICFDLCTTFGAMYARAALPDADPGNAYLVYSLQILPSGFKGLFLAGVLATILSTLDSYLFLAGTTLTHDLLPKRFRSKITLHHLGIVSVGVVSILMALIFDGNIKIVWKTLGSYSAACLLLPVMYGYIFPGKISDKQFSFACVMGVIAVTYWRVLSHTGFWKQVDALYVGILTTGLSLFIWSLIRYIKMFNFSSSNLNSQFEKKD